MCLIIANLNATTIPAEHISNAYGNNPHGFGVMWAENRKLKILRGMYSLNTVHAVIRSIEARNLPFVAHFRYATHGTKNAENCHPFFVADEFGGIGMVHNGTLLGPEWKTENASDTNILSRVIGKHLVKGDFTADDLFSETDTVIGIPYGKALGSDKLVFMSGEGDVSIYNEKNGHMIEGRWYSNTYSLSDNRYSYFDGETEYFWPS